MTLATLHLQDVGHVGPGVAGLLLLPFSLVVVGGAALAAPLLARHRPARVGALGLTVIALGDLVLALTGGAVAAVPVGVAVAGLGIGLSSVAATSIGTDVPDAVQGVASGILNTAAQLGTALGVAGFVLVAAVAGGAGGAEAGAWVAWIGCAALALAGAAAGRLLVLDRGGEGKSSGRRRSARDPETAEGRLSSRPVVGAHAEQGSSAPGR